jgi:putative ABC transport system ATP-binding protein
VIEVNDLSFTYSGAKRINFGSFKMDRGEHCLLLGESGCGKTTLLHLLGGLLKTTSGTIQISNTDVGRLSEPELDAFRGKHLGFVFQRNHLINALNVGQNLLAAQYLSHLKTDSSRAEAVLTDLNLSELKNKRISTLSQGQAQRVAIARALMNKPEVILADEPTSALDDRNCDAVIELLLRVAKENQSTLVIATHDSRLKSKIRRQILLG